MTIYKVLDKDDGFYKKLGKIESLSVGIKDHGLLSLSVMFDFGGSGQGWTIILDQPIKTPNDEFITRMGTEFGSEVIRQLCHAFEVDSICDIKGKVAYALYEEENDFSGYIIGLEVPSFNQKYTKIRQITFKKISDSIEYAKKMEKGEIPYKKMEWS